MKTNVCFVLLLCLLSHGALAQTPAPFPGWVSKSAGAEKTKDYLGQWEGHLTDGDGSKPGQRRMNLSLTITDTQITSTGQGDVRGEGKYKVSGSGAKFRRIDATGTSGPYRGRLYEGIFTVEGDTLKWCAANPGMARPTALKANAGAGHFLMVLKRKQ